MPEPHDLKAELISESQRIEEDALFSGKGHYNEVGPWRICHRGLGVLSALGSTVAAIAVLKNWSPTLAVAAAAIAAVSSVVITTLKPSDEADRHQRAGDRYLSIKNRSRIFRNVDLLAENSTTQQLVVALKSLSSDLDEVRSGAPPIPRRAYLAARKDIEGDNTAQYEADKT
jgi:hypothetical protein